MDSLIDNIKRLNSPIAVGLDVNLKYIPNYIKNMAVNKYGNTPKAASFAIVNFNIAIIDEIKDIAPAIKLQMACYETFGAEGIYALEQTCEYAKKSGLYIILDGKRNDISSSMQYYSNAYLGQVELFNKKKYSPFYCNAITINPYMGEDTIKTAIKSCIKYDKEIFVLVKTSNPSSNQIQDEINKENIYIYEKIANICYTLGKDTIGKYGFSKIGAVVGATQKKHLKYLRDKFDDIFFLVPGFGAQGANAKDVSLCFKNGIGGIINSSRDILTAWQKYDSDEKDFAIFAKKQAIKMRDEIVKKI